MAKASRTRKQNIENPPVETPAAAKARGRAASRPYPHYPFQDALDFAAAIQRIAGSNPIRRLTLFDQLKKSPESGPSRQLITTAARYGLIKGSQSSEQLELTPDGDLATNDDAPERERARAKIALGLGSVEVFSALYERYGGQKLPSVAMLEDTAGEFGILPNLRKECIEIFVVNLRFVGALQTMSGAERILKIDHVLDQIPATSPGASRYASVPLAPSRPLVVHADAEFDRMCFFLGPIGEADSEHRKHSDLILEELIRPAVEPFGFEVRRADEIQNPGLINKQVFEYLLKSRLAIADLSFHNPNVFYELAIRHARNLPTVQIIRQNWRIPFDINQARTIILDMSDIYSWTPKIKTYRLEISNHVRSALENPAAADNPLASYFPDMFPGQ